MMDPKVGFGWRLVGLIGRYPSCQLNTVEFVFTSHVLRSINWQMKSKSGFALSLVHKPRARVKICSLIPRCRVSFPKGFKRDSHGRDSPDRSCSVVYFCNAQPPDLHLTGAVFLDISMPAEEEREP
jgi:hypothetical protein